MSPGLPREGRVGKEDSGPVTRTDLFVGGVGILHKWFLFFHVCKNVLLPCCT